MYMQVLEVGGYSILTEDTLAFGPMEDKINHSWVHWDWEVEPQ